MATVEGVATPNQRRQFLRLFEELVAEDPVKRGSVGRAAERIGTSKEHVSRVKKGKVLGSGALDRAAANLRFDRAYFDAPGTPSYKEYQRTAARVIAGGLGNRTLGEALLTALELERHRDDAEAVERLGTQLAQEILALEAVRAAHALLENKGGVRGEGVRLAWVVRQTIEGDPHVTAHIRGLPKEK